MKKKKSWEILNEIIGKNKNKIHDEVILIDKSDDSVIKSGDDYVSYLNARNMTDNLGINSNSFIVIST